VKRLRAVVVMGVAGVGKTSVGQALADALDWRFEDGDDYHPAANRAKMAAGTPLTDDDRWPWLARLRALLDERIASGEGLVLACSALRRAYRERLGEGDPRLAFLFLDGERDVIAARLAERSGHYMPAALLDSQLATLERPEGAVRIAVDAALDQVVAAALGALEALDRRERDHAPLDP